VRWWPWSTTTLRGQQLRRFVPERAAQPAAGIGRAGAGGLRHAGGARGRLDRGPATPAGGLLPRRRVAQPAGAGPRRGAALGALPSVL
jgi:hypothetical protein